MIVRVTFIHPEKGLQDVSIQDVPSVDNVVTKLRDIGCAVLTAEEEK
jgi:hypothetical protein